jgi:hypothetical protein
MRIVVAPLISQASLDVPPAGILLGVAVKELIVGAAKRVVVFTVTLAVTLSEPRLLVASML